MKYLLMGLLSCLIISFTFATELEQREKNEITYFSKFFQLTYPRTTGRSYRRPVNPWISGTTDPGYKETLALEKQAVDIEQKLLGLLIAIYQQKQHNPYIITLQSIFQICEKISNNFLQQQVCANINEYYLWKEYLISPITLSSVRQTFKKEKNWIYRGASPRDFFENYPLIEHPYMAVRSEFWIGEYLFWIADAYPFGNTGATNFDGIVVLKAGDTHWQKFATIIDPTNPQQGDTHSYTRALTLKNGVLHILLLTKHPDSDNELLFLLQGFKLQKDGNWKLDGCWEYLSWTSERGTEATIKTLPIDTCSGKIDIETNI